MDLSNFFENCISQTFLGTVPSGSPCFLSAECVVSQIFCHHAANENSSSHFGKFAQVYLAVPRIVTLKALLGA